MFEVGKKYTRKDVYKILDVPESKQGGNWNTGYTPYNDDWYIFCNIGVPGRTSHNYENIFIGDDLTWYGKLKRGLNTKSTQSLLKPKGKVYIFYREDNRMRFVYAGIASAKKVYDELPVKIIWEFTNDQERASYNIPEEIKSDEQYFEGATKTIKVNVYERNPYARNKCIESYGATCFVCNFSFRDFYGELGNGYIHVHHEVPISSVGKQYELDPIKDLKPVCPNCHAMIHKKNPPYSISEIKALINAGLKS